MISPAGRRREEFGFTWRNQFSGIFFYLFSLLLFRLRPPPSTACVLSLLFTAPRGALEVGFCCCLPFPLACKQKVRGRCDYSSAPLLVYRPSKRVYIYLATVKSPARVSQSVTSERAHSSTTLVCLFFSSYFYKCLVQQLQ